ncbi:MAG: hypothetical protein CMF59_15670 [Leptospiraceae bacterium]|nr:hypothetical protein [Leptospiraceae bacterium]
MIFSILLVKSIVMKTRYLAKKHPIEAVILQYTVLTFLVTLSGLFSFIFVWKAGRDADAYFIAAGCLIFYISVGFVWRCLWILWKKCAFSITMGAFHCFALRKGSIWHSLKYSEISRIQLRNKMLGLSHWPSVIEVSDQSGRSLWLYPRLDDLRLCVQDINGRAEKETGHPIEGYSEVMEYLRSSQRQ